MKENRSFYLSFAAFCLFSVAVQVFFPYLIIYIQNHLGITDYAIVLGVVLILASVVSVVSGRFIDRLASCASCSPRRLSCSRGLVGMFFVRGSAGVMIAGTVMMSGYMMMTSALGANIHDWTPAGKAWAFPGHTHDICSAAADGDRPRDRRGGHKERREHLCGAGAGKDRSDSGIYLAAAAVLLLTFVPILVLRRKSNKLPPGKLHKIFCKNC